MTETEQAQLIERTVREVMQEEVIPQVWGHVEREMQNAVYLCIEHMRPHVLTQRVDAAVRRLISDRIKITVEVEDT